MANPTVRKIYGLSHIGVGARRYHTRKRGQDRAGHGQGFARWVPLGLALLGLFLWAWTTHGETVTASGTTVVPSNWPLVPAGLSSGDEFRLLAKTKNPLKPPNLSSSDIAVYNTYVQDQIRTRGHGAVKEYADAFRVLGSTSDVNARANTGTTGTGGVPIYWLNGSKVADDYDDFYDGTWSNKNNGRGVAGDSIVGTSASGRQRLCTGTADDGTTTSLPLGGADPDSDDTHECTATSIAITSNTLSGAVADVSGRARFLALSNVFQVGTAADPVIEDVSITSDPGSDGEYVVGDDIQFTVTFSETVTVTGTPQLVFKVDHMIGWRVVQRNRIAEYDAESSTSTALVFSYTVRSVDFDKNGIRVKRDSLSLNGGTIKSTADVDADLSHDGLGVLAGHKIHIIAAAQGAEVISTPEEGGSYSTGETIRIEVTFNRNVRVITEDGTPTYEMFFQSVPHYATYVGVVEGNKKKIQFEYVVQEGDHDPDGFVAHRPAIHWNRGIITRDEVDDSIALAVRAKLFGTELLLQNGHAVNAE